MKKHCNIKNIISSVPVLKISMDVSLLYANNSFFKAVGLNDDSLLFIKMLQKSGVQIALDDFGSEYANMSKLYKLKPNIVKFDGDFIRNCCVSDYIGKPQALEFYIEREVKVG